MKRDDVQASRRAREVAERAIRRLNVLEWVILGAAAVLALLAGALGAFLLQAAFGLAFRPTWAALSIALFGIPAAVAYLRERKYERERKARRQLEADTEQRERGPGEAWPTKRS